MAPRYFLKNSYRVLLIISATLWDTVSMKINISSPKFDQALEIKRIELLLWVNSNLQNNCGLTRNFLKISYIRSLDIFPISNLPNIPIWKRLCSEWFWPIVLTCSRYGTGIWFLQGPRSKCSAPSQGKRFRNRSQGTVIQNQ